MSDFPWFYKAGVQRLPSRFQLLIGSLHKLSPLFGEHDNRKGPGVAAVFFGVCCDDNRALLDELEPGERGCILTPGLIVTAIMNADEIIRKDRPKSADLPHRGSLCRA